MICGCNRGNEHHHHHYHPRRRCHPSSFHGSWKPGRLAGRQVRCCCYGYRQSISERRDPGHEDGYNDRDQEESEDKEEESNDNKKEEDDDGYTASDHAYMNVIHTLEGNIDNNSVEAVV